MKNIISFCLIIFISSPGIAQTAWNVTGWVQNVKFSPPDPQTQFYKFFISVTDVNGKPVTGLTYINFNVTTSTNDVSTSTNSYETLTVANEGGHIIFKEHQPGYYIMRYWDPNNTNGIVNDIVITVSTVTRFFFPFGLGVTPDQHGQLLLKIMNPYN